MAQPGVCSVSRAAYHRAFYARTAERRRLLRRESARALRRRQWALWLIHGVLEELNGTETGLRVPDQARPGP